MIKRIKFIVSELNKLIKDKILIIKNNKKYKLKDLLSSPKILINGQVLHICIKQMNLGFIRKTNILILLNIKTI